MKRTYDDRIWVDTLFGAETRLGLVQLSFGETTVQLDPKEACELASNIFQAAEAARGEQMIVGFFEKFSNDGAPLDPHAIGHILHDLRRFREDEQQRR